MAYNDGMNALARGRGGKGRSPGAMTPGMRNTMMPMRQDIPPMTKQGKGGSPGAMVPGGIMPPQSQDMQRPEMQPPGELQQTPGVKGGSTGALESGAMPPNPYQTKEMQGGMMQNTMMPGAQPLSVQKPGGKGGSAGALAGAPMKNRIDALRGGGY